MIKAVIFDIDDTLYDYVGANAVAFPALCQYVQAELGIPADLFARECDRVLCEMTEELTDQAAIHDRNIRFLRILEKYRKPLHYAPILDAYYWNAMLEHTIPAPGLTECLKGLKAIGCKIGIGSNMTLHWQIKKLEKLGVLPYIDFIVTSEEAGAEKPASPLFALCARKAGCTPEECLFVGDSVENDMEGSRNFGMHPLLYAPNGSSGEYPSISHFDQLIPLLTKKAIFLDLDGTLLNDQKEITPGNREALQEALRQGHRVIITTGRALPSTMDLTARLGLSREGCYLIAFNGGMLYDLHRKRVVTQNTIPVGLANELFDVFDRAGIHLQTYDRTGVVIPPRWEDEGLREYCAINRISYRILPHCQEAPCKMLAMRMGDAAPILALREDIVRKYGDRIDCFFSSDIYLEIVPKGVNKGQAIIALCSSLGVPPENTIAVGDAENDLSMIAMAHIGVSMANGTPAAKAAADYITTHDNNHDGVAEVVHKFILNQ